MQWLTEDSETKEDKAITRGIGHLILKLPKPILLVLGVALIGYGVYILYLHFTGHDFWGYYRGTWAYVAALIISLVLGLMLIVYALADILREKKLRKIEDGLDREN